jgi:cytosine/adenosine deaminase-related metal-dependent hydrolase
MSSTTHHHHADADAAHRAAILERLRHSDSDPARRILIEGATVLTMDRELGDFPRADVLVVGTTIAAVGPGLADAAGAAGSIVIPADGMIAIPGLQDTHRHCWQNQFRRLVPACDLPGYQSVMLRTLAPHYVPEDTYAATLVSALGAIDSGVTCMLDFAHNTRSGQHADAGIEALREVGLRGVHTSAAPMFGTWDRQWPQDTARVRSEHFASAGQLLSLRLGLYGYADIGGEWAALTADTLAFARELGIGVAVDGFFGPQASANLEELGRAGLLGPDITLIHCNDLSDDAWRMIADAGVTVSLCPTSDTQIGILDAIPPIDRTIELGVTSGISVDVECSLSTDMFAQMQSILTTQRMLAFNRRYRGEEPGAEPIGVRHPLELATIHGARTNGVADVVGTLAPGREADIVLIGAEDINTMPLNNAVATVVLGATSANVDTVLIAGSVKKWAGRLVGPDIARVRRLVHASRDRLVADAGYPLDVVADEPAWTATT